jgi:hypothetical protein
MFTFITKKGVKRMYIVVDIKLDKWDREMFEIQFDGDDDSFPVWVDKERFEELQRISMSIGLSF